MYGFICRFTQLRGKVEGLETPMECVAIVFFDLKYEPDVVENTVSFEDALLSPEANPIMTQILSRFVLNLRSQTRNLR